MHIPVERHSHGAVISLAGLSSRQDSLRSGTLQQSAHSGAGGSGSDGICDGKISNRETSSHWPATYSLWRGIKAQGHNAGWSGVILDSSSGTIPRADRLEL